MESDWLEVLVPVNSKFSMLSFSFNNIKHVFRCLMDVSPQQHELSQIFGAFEQIFEIVTESLHFQSEHHFGTLRVNRCFLIFDMITRYITF